LPSPTLQVQSNHNPAVNPFLLHQHLIKWPVKFVHKKTRIEKFERRICLPAHKGLYPILDFSKEAGKREETTFEKGKTITKWIIPCYVFDSGQKYWWKTEAVISPDGSIFLRKPAAERSVTPHTPAKLKPIIRADANNRLEQLRENTIAKIPEAAIDQPSSSDLGLTKRFLDLLYKFKVPIISVITCIVALFTIPVIPGLIFMWHLYLSFLSSSPFIAKLVTAFILALTGDLLAQHFEQKKLAPEERKINAKRLVITTFVLTLSNGILLPLWFELLDILTTCTALKWVLQCSIYSPAFFLAFFPSIVLLSKDSLRESFSRETFKEAAEASKNKFIPALKKDFMIWSCMIHPFNFFGVPFIVRLFGIDASLTNGLMILVVSIASVFWNMYLSLTAYKKKTPPPPAENINIEKIEPKVLIADADRTTTPTDTKKDAVITSKITSHPEKLNQYPNFPFRLSPDNKNIFLGDLLIPQELSFSLVNMLLSRAATKTVVLAFDKGLGKIYSKKILSNGKTYSKTILLVVKELDRLKKKKRFKELLKNVVIIDDEPQNFSSELEKYINDENAEVFMFARQTDSVKKTLKKIEKEVHAVYIDEIPEEKENISSKELPYYPLPEIVTITLAQFIKSDILDSIPTAILKEMNIESAKEDDGVLFFTVLPKAKRMTETELIQYYAALKRALKSA